MARDGNAPITYDDEEAGILNIEEENKFIAIDVVDASKTVLNQDETYL